MAATDPLSRMKHLSDLISKSITRLQEAIDESDISSSAIDGSAPFARSNMVSGARDDIIDAAEELRDLMLDPMTLIFKYTGVRLHAECASNGVTLSK